MKILICWFLSQVFGEMLSLYERIVIVSLKPGDKTYKEMRQLYHEIWDPDPLSISRYLWTNSEKSVAWRMKKHPGWPRPSNYTIKSIPEAVERSPRLQLLWYWPLLRIIFHIFKGTADTPLHRFYPPIPRKRWPFFPIRGEILQISVKEISRLLFS